MFILLLLGNEYVPPINDIYDIGFINVLMESYIVYIKKNMSYIITSDLNIDFKNFYKYLVILYNSNGDINQICNVNVYNYLKILKWNLLYYNKNCSNFSDIIYTNTKTPSIKQLIEYIKNSKYEINISIYYSFPLTTEEQLIAILPYHSYIMLFGNKYNYILEKYKSYFPTEFKIYRHIINNQLKAYIPFFNPKYLK